MPHPERLGKYPITAVLGEGAMGVVYKAFDPHIKRPVAIKTIRRQLIEDSELGQSAVARFCNEAQAAGRLLHPGIVTVYEYGEDQEQAYIAMEYVEGHSLAKYLARKVRFPEADILSIMSQLLLALDHAHEQGVWHRDIKPANLIITRQGRVKIADFGIARVDAVGLTQVNSVVGTPGYMSPEQYTGQPVDHRVDIWAAGVVLYQLLTGQLPFNGSAQSLMYKIVHEEPVWPSEHAGLAWARRYDAILAQALSKRPDGRYASALAFREALLSQTSEPVQPVVSEETVIMDLGRHEGRSAGTPSQGGSGAGAVTTAPPSGWDADTLSRLEASLARFVGPVAKVLVRRAARDCADIDTLAARLAGHLQTDQERAAFLQQTGSRPKAPGPASTGSGMTATLVMDTTRLDAAVVDQAQRILAAHIGPIAKIIARQAAAQAATRSAFFELVCARIDNEDERARVLAELRAIP